MKDENGFKPFIPADKVVPEVTAVSVILGILLAVLFGAANAYLGLRVGMTVSASIPAAVISMGVIRVILRRDSILENNMVQTIGSAGESVAAGAIFTLPALFMWMRDWGEGAPSLVEIALIALCGGVLGVLFMIPLRQALIVKEHGVLPYPEGQACAEVLIAGEQGGSKAGVVFAGMGIAALYKFVADGLKLFPGDVDYDIRKYGGGVGISVLPALAGVGYICGPKISSYMFSGGIISWLILMPIIKLFGGGLTTPFAPADVLISEMSSQAMWGSYIRYIGRYHKPDQVPSHDCKYLQGCYAGLEGRTSGFHPAYGQGYPYECGTHRRPHCRGNHMAGAGCSCKLCGRSADCRVRFPVCGRVLTSGGIGWFLQ